MRKCCQILSATDRMNSESLDDWLIYIESFNPKEIELGLSRIKQVAVSLDCLSLDSKVVLIAGTNGKGSCVATLESIALNQGKSVACYTSPHLLAFNERIRFNGKNASDHELVTAFQAIEAQRQNTPLTFFEFTTLAALLIFKQHQPELVILEVGLGGRQDATNVIDPDVSVITTVALDHTDWLGDTLEAIAYEKGGIIRPGKPAIVGDTETFNLLNKVLPEHSAELVLISDAAHSAFLRDIRVNPYCLLEQNLLLAKMAFEKAFDYSLTEINFIESIKSICLEGRFQQIEGLDPVTIVDVAHNPQSAENLLRQLSGYVKANSVKRVTAILGMMADKSVMDVIKILDPLVNDWCFVDLDNQRSISSQGLKQEYRRLEQSSKSTSNCFDSVKLAYQWFIQKNNSKRADELLVVFGSFITVANMLQYAKEIRDNKLKE